MKNTVFIKRPMVSAPYVVSRRKQFGGMMIESLIGLLLLGIIGGGIMHTTTRMANTQRDLAVNNIAINQMRSMLMTRTSAGADICTSVPKVNLPGSSSGGTGGSGSSGVDVTVNGCASANMKITGVAIGGTTLGEQTVSAMQPLVLETGTGDNLVRIGGVGR